MPKQFYFKQISWALVRCLNIETALFLIIRFSINTQFSSIWPIDRTLSGATTPGQSGPGSDGFDRILHIPQSASLTGISDCLVSYDSVILKDDKCFLNMDLNTRWGVGGFYSSAVMQSVYSTISADWVICVSAGACVCVFGIIW